MIPQIQPWIDDEELVQLQRVIKSTYLVEHDLTKEFEAMTKKLTGSPHAIAMTNGTTALYCCLKACGIGPGDEVILPDLTFIASANAVIMAGATPVFCDVDPKTFCLDLQAAASLVTSRTRALMPVHLYGQSADMPAVMKLAKERRLRVIEDAAQGVGVLYNNQHVGTFGDFGVLSYYGNKTITCGEGGMILTADEEMAKKCYRLKNHGREKKGIFIHEDIGFNFSFTEMQAAIGIAQMNKLERIRMKKESIYRKYVSSWEGLSGLEPVYYDPKCRPVYWFTSFLCSDAEALGDYLSKNGVQTRRFFYPLHMQPCYEDHSAGGAFPVSRSVYERGISFPSSYSLTDAEQDAVIRITREYYAHRN